MNRHWTRTRTTGWLLAMALSVPAGESLAGTSDFTVQYQNYNATGPSDGIIEAGLKLRNNTASAVSLSGLVVRYWFTKNGATTVAPACWWWNPACSNITLATGAVSYTGADQYVEVRFNAGAGSLAAGATTEPIDLGITFGGTATNEADDYSYANQTAFADWSHVTVHDVGSAPNAGLRGGTLPGGTVSAEFFDDFSYTGPGDTNFTSRWAVRSWGGAPGVSGAQWLTSNVSMIADPALSGNKLMRLQGSTSGSGASTTQSEVMSTARKFQYGTYATRIKFNHAALSGTRTLGDKTIQTFFTITPYVANDPNYSEQDFEYMPNGGWGQGNTNTLWLTSWETTTTSTSNSVASSMDGWHTLMLQISSSSIAYSIDGVLRATHPGMYSPEAGQYLAYQLWFDTVDTAQGAARTYSEETDWVYFAKDTLLSINDVTARVSALRSAGTTRKDTVP